MRNKLFVLYAILVAFLVTSCRDDNFVPVVIDNVIEEAETDKVMNGMYVICEGNMGSNKCTVDYLDLSSTDGQVHYMRNIYAQRNPNTVLELGDVGNDIQCYGSRLWLVVNCSNKVEVCTADSLKRIGQVNIPNCRYVTFSNGYAYVSSYVGPVKVDANAQIGRVYKVDTLTLEKVDSVTVGYQPEELAVVDNKLYVANSGGYRVPDYDRTVSVIDLATFKEERKIDVDVNLHRLRADKYGQVWVSSRGDYYENHSKLHYLTKDANGNMQYGGCVDVPVSEMCIVGDTLYYMGTSWSSVTNSNTKDMGLVNVRTHEKIQTTMFNSVEAKGMTLPYGMIVHPVNKDFYLFDAKDYVSSGKLLHFDADGKFLWSANTGDIPSRAVFVSSIYNPTEADYKPSIGGSSPYIAAVDEYVPAPGQFINTMPLYEEGDDAAAMARKCTEAIADNNGGMVSLGGYGGYITFHFDHSVKNVDGEYDIYIKGNAMDNGSEPGIVMVSKDTNGNGLPDDEWYELSGSADVDSIGKVKYGYEITYTYKEMSDVPWTDNMSGSGTVDRNTYHTQEYFPLWLLQTQAGRQSVLTFKGTLLPNNAYDKSGKGTMWVLPALRYGYVDNIKNSNAEGNSFDIGWAVEPESRTPVYLDYVDFVRVYTGMNQKAGWLGETSTEITGAKDLHYK